MRKHLVLPSAVFVVFALGVFGAANGDVRPRSARVALPGADPFPPEMTHRLWEAWQAQGKPVYSKHRRPDGLPRYLNRLILEANPYLQLHAEQPVDWYPWTAETLARAKRENKPIFLSIGYASCHWCHVMAEESFDDEGIATLLNREFVSIKVDREERPDVDAVYVAAVQRLTGNAGWPLSVFLTPDGEPFYGGTYFPPRDRDGRPGLKRVLETVLLTWKAEAERAKEAASSLRAVLSSTQPVPGEVKDEAVLRRAAAQLAKLFDAEHGGFGRAPKFPQPHVLQFLLRYGQRSGDKAAFHMVTFTLERMARGGIDDLIGGGFHRYSTDSAWRVPHFEKMLYDQAGLALAYLEAARATQSIEPLSTAVDILQYVLRNLQDPAGGFYAAQDARSGTAEGAYYMWTRDEILRALGAEDGPWVADFFGLPSDPTVRTPLHIPLAPDQFLRQRGMRVDSFARKLASARAALLAVRDQRPRPAVDEKLITAWNGWMIAALSEAASQLDDSKYLQAATRAAERVLKDLQAQGQLWRSLYRGKRSLPGFLDDYAFLAFGLHRLYEASGNIRWLEEAERLLDELLRRFDEPTSGNLRYAQAGQEPPLPVVWNLEDAALPAAQSVAALELLRMGHLLQKRRYTERAEVLLRANGADVSRAPTAYTFLLQAIEFALGPRQEIVIVGPTDGNDTKALRRTVARAFLPRAVVVHYQPGDRRTERLLPFVSKQTMRGGKATAYVCENFYCKLPTNDAAELGAQLAGLQAPPATPRSEPEPALLPKL